jgi:hypothetical protein
MSFLDMLYHVSLFVQYHSKSSFVSLFIPSLRDFEHFSLLDEFANRSNSPYPLRVFFYMLSLQNSLCIIYNDNSTFNGE